MQRNIKECGLDFKWCAGLQPESYFSLEKWEGMYKTKNVAYSV